MDQWTSAAEELEALRRSATAAQCVVRQAAERNTPRGRRGVATVTCADGWAAARFLLAQALEDSRTLGARELAADLRWGTSSEAEYVSRVFEYVKDRVRFEREPGEVFARSDYTLATGSGDCDDHARVVYALLRAGGVAARLAFLYRKGDRGPRHVVAQAGVRGRGWVWLETTVDAKLGEPPFDAAKRLGVVKNRTDIATEVRTMTEDDLQPAPAGFAAHTSPAQLAVDVAKLKELGFLDDLTPCAADETSFRLAVGMFQESRGLTIDGLIGPQTRAALGSLAAPGNHFTHAQARAALHEAYVNLFKREPLGGEIDFGLATAYFETFYGRGTGAEWGDGGQFGRWASEGKLNWGALQSASPGTEATQQAFETAGLHPTKEQGRDAGRPVYFYLFPTDLEAATAFLMSWGKKDILGAAQTGSATAVSTAMRRHNYYEGFHVGPGGLVGQKTAARGFKEEESDEVALQKNIADYASALARTVRTVGGPGGVPDPYPGPAGSGSSVLGAVVAVLLVASTVAGAWYLGGRA